MKPGICLTLVALAVTAASGTATAATLFTSQAEFLSRVTPGIYFEDFGSMVDYGKPIPGDPPPDPVPPALSWAAPGANGFTWTAQAPHGLYSLPQSLSVNDHQDPLTIHFTGRPVTAIGGNFLAGDLNGIPISGVVQLKLSDGSLVNLTDPDLNTFTGFISDVPITSLTFDALDVVDDLLRPERHWPQIKDFYAGEAIGSPIPEPEDYAFVMGLGALAFGIWRRVRG